MNVLVRSGSSPCESSGESKRAEQRIPDSAVSCPQRFFVDVCNMNDCWKDSTYSDLRTCADYEEAGGIDTMHTLSSPRLQQGVWLGHTGTNRRIRLVSNEGVV